MAWSRTPAMYQLIFNWNKIDEDTPWTNGTLLSLPYGSFPSTVSSVSTIFATVQEPSDGGTTFSVLDIVLTDSSSSEKYAECVKEI